MESGSEELVNKMISGKEAETIEGTDSIPYEEVKPSTSDIDADAGGGGGASLEMTMTADDSEPLNKGQLSPLSGSYLLIVLAEPHSIEDRERIIKRLTKGLLSWDVNLSHVDLNCELLNLSNSAPDGDEGRNGEKLVQWASENLVVEVLIHSQVNTLLQCMKNLLSSFTRHRHIIHAGYTFQGTGSWILQDGTFSSMDFLELWSEPEVVRLLTAYKNDVSVVLQCAAENGWTEERLRKESFSKLCQVTVNSPDKLSHIHNAGVSSFIEYLSKFVLPSPLTEILESSDIVGNIRFSHPTLYVFPGGQGDAALFGVNGFNMLIDGGFARKACFWDFTRHLDRLDAVLLTRVNNNSIGGLGAILDRKNSAQVFPQIGHFFGNIIETQTGGHEDKEKEVGAKSDDLVVSLTEQGHRMVENLRNLSLRPQLCYRDSTLDPVNLYHKVGHGKLDLYILNPARDSRELKEFLSKWSSNSAATAKLPVRGDPTRELSYPVLNLVSICALLVWQPANPKDRITRILFPGSTPQHKIFEALSKLKHLDFLRHPVCSAESLAATQKSKLKSETLVSEAKYQLSSALHSNRSSGTTVTAGVQKSASQVTTKTAKANLNKAEKQQQQTNGSTTNKTESLSIVNKESETNGTSKKVESQEQTNGTAETEKSETKKRPAIRGRKTEKSIKAISNGNGVEIIEKSSAEKEVLIEKSISKKLDAKPVPKIIPATIDNKQLENGKELVATITKTSTTKTMTSKTSEVVPISKTLSAAKVSSRPPTSGKKTQGLAPENQQSVVRARSPSREKESGATKSALSSAPAKTSKYGISKSNSKTSAAAVSTDKATPPIGIPPALPKPTRESSASPAPPKSIKESSSFSAPPKSVKESSSFSAPAKFVKDSNSFSAAPKSAKESSASPVPQKSAKELNTSAVSVKPAKELNTSVVSVKPAKELNTSAVSVKPAKELNTSVVSVKPAKELNTSAVSVKTAKELNTSAVSVKSAKELNTSAVSVKSAKELNTSAVSLKSAKETNLSAAPPKIKESNLTMAPPKSTKEAVNRSKVMTEQKEIIKSHRQVPVSKSTQVIASAPTSVTDNLKGSEAKPKQIATKPASKSKGIPRPSGIPSSTSKASEKPGSGKPGEKLGSGKPGDKTGSGKHGEKPDSGKPPASSGIKAVKRPSAIASAAAAVAGIAAVGTAVVVSGMENGAPSVDVTVTNGDVITSPQDKLEASLVSPDTKFEPKVEAGNDSDALQFPDAIPSIENLNGLADSKSPIVDLEVETTHTYDIVEKIEDDAVEIVPIAALAVESSSELSSLEPEISLSSVSQDEIETEAAIALEGTPSSTRTVHNDNETPLATKLHDSLEDPDNIDKEIEDEEDEYLVVEKSFEEDEFEIERAMVVAQTAAPEESKNIEEMEGDSGQEEEHEEDEKLPIEIVTVTTTSTTIDAESSSSGHQIDVESVSPETQEYQENVNLKAEAVSASVIQELIEPTVKAATEPATDIVLDELQIDSVVVLESSESSPPVIANQIGLLEENEVEESTIIESTQSRKLEIKMESSSEPQEEEEIIPEISSVKTHISSDDGGGPVSPNLILNVISDLEQEIIRSQSDVSNSGAGFISSAEEGSEPGSLIITEKEKSELLMSADDSKSEIQVLDEKLPPTDNVDSFMEKEVKVSSTEEVEEDEIEYQNRIKETRSDSSSTTVHALISPQSTVSENEAEAEESQEVFTGINADKRKSVDSPGGQEVRVVQTQQAEIGSFKIENNKGEIQVEESEQKPIDESFSDKKKSVEKEEVVVVPLFEDKCKEDEVIKETEVLSGHRGDSPEIITGRKRSSIKEDEDHHVEALESLSQVESKEEHLTKEDTVLALETQAEILLSESPKMKNLVDTQPSLTKSPEEIETETETEDQYGRETQKDEMGKEEKDQDELSQKTVHMEKEHFEDLVTGDKNEDEFSKQQEFVEKILPEKGIDELLSSSSEVISTTMATVISLSSPSATSESLKGEKELSLLSQSIIEAQDLEQVFPSVTDKEIHKFQETSLTMLKLEGVEEDTKKQIMIPMELEDDVKPSEESYSFSKDDNDYSSIHIEKTIEKLDEISTVKLDQKNEMKIENNIDQSEKTESSQDRKDEIPHGQNDKGKLFSPGKSQEESTSILESGKEEISPARSDKGQITATICRTTEISPAKSDKGEVSPATIEKEEILEEKIETGSISPTKSEKELLFSKNEKDEIEKNKDNQEITNLEISVSEMEIHVSEEEILSRKSITEIVKSGEISPAKSEEDVAKSGEISPAKSEKGVRIRKSIDLSPVKSEKDVQKFVEITPDKSEKDVTISDQISPAKSEEYITKSGEQSTAKSDQDGSKSVEISPSKSIHEIMKSGEISPAKSDKDVEEYVEISQAKSEKDATISDQILSVKSEEDITKSIEISPAKIGKDVIESTENFIAQSLEDVTLKESSPPKIEKQISKSEEISPAKSEKDITSVDISPDKSEKEVKSVEVLPGESEKEVKSVEISPAKGEKDVKSVEVSPVKIEKEIKSVEISPAKTEEDITSVEISPAKSDKEVESVEVSPGEREKEVRSVEVSLAKSEKEVESVEVSPGEHEKEVKSVEVSPGEHEIEVKSVEVSPAKSEKEVKSVEVSPAKSEKEVKSVEISPARDEKDVKSVEVSPAIIEKEVKSVEISSAKIEEDITSVEILPAKSEKEIESVEVSPGEREKEVKSVEVSPAKSEKEVESVEVSPGEHEIEVKSVEVSPAKSEKEVKSVEISPAKIEEDITSVEVSPGEREKEVKSVEMSPAKSEKEVESVEVSIGEHEKEVKSVEVSPGEHEIEVKSVEVSPAKSEKEVKSVEVSPTKSEKEVKSVEISQAKIEEDITSVDISPDKSEKEVESVEVSPGESEKEVKSVEVSPAKSEKEVKSVEISPAKGEKDVKSVEVSPAKSEKEIKLVEVSPDVKSVEISPEKSEKEVKSVEVSPAKGEKEVKSVKVSPVKSEKEVKSVEISPAKSEKEVKSVEISPALSERDLVELVELAEILPGKSEEDVESVEISSVKRASVKSENVESIESSPFKIVGSGSQSVEISPAKIEKDVKKTEISSIRGEKNGEIFGEISPAVSEKDLAQTEEISSGKSEKNGEKSAGISSAISEKDVSRSPQIPADKIDKELKSVEILHAKSEKDSGISGEISPAVSEKDLTQSAEISSGKNDNEEKYIETSPAKIVKEVEISKEMSPAVSESDIAQSDQNSTDRIGKDAKSVEMSAAQIEKDISASGEASPAQHEIPVGKSGEISPLRSEKAFDKTEEITPSKDEKLVEISPVKIVKGASDSDKLSLTKKDRETDVMKLEEILSAKSEEDIEKSAQISPKTLETSPSKSETDFTKSDQISSAKGEEYDTKSIELSSGKIEPDDSKSLEISSAKSKKDDTESVEICLAKSDKDTPKSDQISAAKSEEDITKSVKLSYGEIEQDGAKSTVISPAESDKVVPKFAEDSPTKSDKDVTKLDQISLAKTEDVSKSVDPVESEQDDLKFVKISTLDSEKDVLESVQISPAKDVLESAEISPGKSEKDLPKSVEISPAKSEKDLPKSVEISPAKSEKDMPKSAEISPAKSEKDMPKSAEISPAKSENDLPKSGEVSPAKSEEDLHKSAEISTTKSEEALHKSAEISPATSEKDLPKSVEISPAKSEKDLPKSVEISPAKSEKDMPKSAEISPAKSAEDLRRSAELSSTASEKDLKSVEITPAKSEKDHTKSVEISPAKSEKDLPKSAEVSSTKSEEDLHKSGEISTTKSEEDLHKSAEISPATSEKDLPKSVEISPAKSEKDLAISAEASPAKSEKDLPKSAEVSPAKSEEYLHKSAEISPATSEKDLPKSVEISPAKSEKGHSKSVIPKSAEVSITKSEEHIHKSGEISPATSEKDHPKSVEISPAKSEKDLPKSAEASPAKREKDLPKSAEVSPVKSEEDLHKSAEISSATTEKDLPKPVEVSPAKSEKDLAISAEASPAKSEKDLPKSAEVSPAKSEKGLAIAAEASPAKSEKDLPKSAEDSPAKSEKDLPKSGEVSPAKTEKDLPKSAEVSPAKSEKDLPKSAEVSPAKSEKDFPKSAEISSSRSEKDLPKSAEVSPAKSEKDLPKSAVVTPAKSEEDLHESAEMSSATSEKDLPKSAEVSPARSEKDLPKSAEVSPARSEKDLPKSAEVSPAKSEKDLPKSAEVSPARSEKDLPKSAEVSPAKSEKDLPKTAEVSSAKTEKDLKSAKISQANIEKDVSKSADISPAKSEKDFPKSAEVFPAKSEKDVSKSVEISPTKNEKELLNSAEHSPAKGEKVATQQEQLSSSESYNDVPIFAEISPAATGKDLTKFDQISSGKTEGVSKLGELSPGGFEEDFPKSLEISSAKSEKDVPKSVEISPANTEEVVTKSDHIPSAKSEEDVSKSVELSPAQGKTNITESVEISPAISQKDLPESVEPSSPKSRKHLPKSVEISPAKSEKDDTQHERISPTENDKDISKSIQTPSPKGEKDLVQYEQISPGKTEKDVIEFDHISSVKTQEDFTKLAELSPGKSEQEGSKFVEMSIAKSEKDVPKSEEISRAKSEKDVSKSGEISSAESEKDVPKSGEISPAKSEKDVPKSGEISPAKIEKDVPKSGEISPAKSEKDVPNSGEISPAKSEKDVPKSGEISPAKSEKVVSKSVELSPDKSDQAGSKSIEMSPIRSEEGVPKSVKVSPTKGDKDITKSDQIPSVKTEEGITKSIQISPTKSDQDGSKFVDISQAKNKEDIIKFVEAMDEQDDGKSEQILPTEIGKDVTKEELSLSPAKSEKDLGKSKEISSTETYEGRLEEISPSHTVVEITSKGESPLKTDDYSPEKLSEFSVSPIHLKDETVEKTSSRKPSIETLELSQTEPKTEKDIVVDESIISPLKPKHETQPSSISLEESLHLEEYLQSEESSPLYKTAIKPTPQKEETKSVKLESHSPAKDKDKDKDKVSPVIEETISSVKAMYLGNVQPVEIESTFTEQKVQLSKGETKLDIISPIKKVSPFDFEAEIVDAQETLFKKCKPQELQNEPQKYPVKEESAKPEQTSSLEIEKSISLKGSISPVTGEIHKASSKPDISIPPSFTSGAEMDTTLHKCDEKRSSIIPEEDLSDDEHEKLSPTKSEKELKFSTFEIVTEKTVVDLKSSSSKQLDKEISQLISESHSSSDTRHRHKPEVEILSKTTTISHTIDEPKIKSSLTKTEAVSSHLNELESFTMKKDSSVSTEYESEEVEQYPISSSTAISTFTSSISTGATTSFNIPENWSETSTTVSSSLKSKLKVEEEKEGDEEITLELKPFLSKETIQVEGDLVAVADSTVTTLIKEIETKQFISSPSSPPSEGTLKSKVFELAHEGVSEIKFMETKIHLSPKELKAADDKEKEDEDTSPVDSLEKELGAKDLKKLISPMGTDKESVLLESSDVEIISKKETDSKSKDSEILVSSYDDDSLMFSSQHEAMQRQEEQDANKVSSLTGTTVVGEKEESEKEMEKDDPIPTTSSKISNEELKIKESDGVEVKRITPLAEQEIIKSPEEESKKIEAELQGKSILIESQDSKSLPKEKEQKFQQQSEQTSVKDDKYKQMPQTFYEQTSGTMLDRGKEINFEESIPSPAQVTQTTTPSSRPIPIPSAIPPSFPREARDVIRTPDEVAELPMHEEVDPRTYETDERHHFPHSGTEEDDDEEDVLNVDVSVEEHYQAGVHIHGTEMSASPPGSSIQKKPTEILSLNVVGEKTLVDKKVEKTDDEITHTIEIKRDANILDFKTIDVKPTTLSDVCDTSLENNENQKLVPSPNESEITEESSSRQTEMEADIPPHVPHTAVIIIEKSVEKIDSIPTTEDMVSSSAASAALDEIHSSDKNKLISFSISPITVTTTSVVITPSTPPVRQDSADLDTDGREFELPPNQEDCQETTQEVDVDVTDDKSTKLPTATTTVSDQEQHRDSISEIKFEKVTIKSKSVAPSAISGEIEEAIKELGNGSSITTARAGMFYVGDDQDEEQEQETELHFQDDLKSDIEDDEIYEIGGAAAISPGGTISTPFGPAGSVIRSGLLCAATTVSASVIRHSPEEFAEKDSKENSRSPSPAEEPVFEKSAAVVSALVAVDPAAPMAKSPDMKTAKYNEDAKVLSSMQGLETMTTSGMPAADKLVPELEQNVNSNNEVEIRTRIGVSTDSDLGVRPRTVFVLEKDIVSDSSIEKTSAGIVKLGQSQVSVSSSTFENNYNKIPTVAAVGGGNMFDAGSSKKEKLEKGDEEKVVVKDVEDTSSRQSFSKKSIQEHEHDTHTKIYESQVTCESTAPFFQPEKLENQLSKTQTIEIASSGKPIIQSGDTITISKIIKSTVVPPQGLALDSVTSMRASLEAFTSDILSEAEQMTAESNLSECEANVEQVKFEGNKIIKSIGEDSSIQLKKGTLVQIDPTEEEDELFHTIDTGALSSGHSSLEFRDTRIPKDIYSSDIDDDDGGVKTSVTKTILSTRRYTSEDYPQVSPPQAQTRDMQRRFSEATADISTLHSKSGDIKWRDDLPGSTKITITTTTRTIPPTEGSSPDLAKQHFEIDSGQVSSTSYPSGHDYETFVMETTSDSGEGTEGTETARQFFTTGKTAFETSTKTTTTLSSHFAQMQHQYETADDETYSSGDFSDSQLSTVPQNITETDDEMSQHLESQQQQQQQQPTKTITMTQTQSSQEYPLGAQFFESRPKSHPLDFHLEPQIQDVENGNAGGDGGGTIITRTTRTILDSTGKSITTVTTTTRQQQSSSTSSSSTSRIEEEVINEEEAEEIFKKWGKPLGLPAIHPEVETTTTTTGEGGAIGTTATPKKDKSSTNKSGPGTPGKVGITHVKKTPMSHHKSKNLLPIHIDLAYVPHHGNSNYCDSEFFRLIRARYYVFSGLEPSRKVFDGLLEGKQAWDDKNLDVTIIPTYDTDSLGYWVTDSEAALTEAHIDLAPSASRCTINLQDHETCCSAYRLEF